MNEFNKKYVCFGRVVEGFSVIKRINNEHNQMDLRPTSSVRIESFEVIEKKIPRKESCVNLLEEILDK